MSSDKLIQQQSELSDTNDELIRANQKRDVQAEKRNLDRQNTIKKMVQNKVKESGSGLVEMSEKSKRARSSG